MIVELKIELLIKSFVLIIVFSGFLEAGPPFFTDDPEPVDYRHWEFYICSQMQFSENDVDATLPHIETNYGLVPNVQVHLIIPMQYSKREASTQYSYSSTEVGVKYRFVNINDNIQVGTFPIALLPTGKAPSLGVDNKLKVFLPLWLQYNSENFATYGGAGYWINPGKGNKNWLYAGWQAQYDFSKTFTLGGELFYHTPDSEDGTSEAGFNIGGFINITEHHHILFSLGHNLSGTTSTTGYLGYQLTI